MSNSDNAVASTDEKLKKPRKKRDVFFIGLVGAQHAKIEFSGSDWSKADAEAKLEQELGKPAKTIYGPFYEVKGDQKDESERATITVAADDVFYTSTRFKGEYNGWKVIATGVKGLEIEDEIFADNELVSLMFEGPADPENKVRKPRMTQNQLVRAEDIIKA